MTSKAKPAVKGATVTASDSTELLATRALWVGGAGDVAVLFADDASAVTIAGVNAGTLLPVSVVKVMATNTTATDIVAMW